MPTRCPERRDKEREKHFKAWKNFQRHVKVFRYIEWPMKFELCLKAFQDVARPLDAIKDFGIVSNCRKAFQRRFKMWKGFSRLGKAFQGLRHRIDIVSTPYRHRADTVSTEKRQRTRETFQGNYGKKFRYMANYFAM